MAHDAFISYAAADQAVAEAICETLEGTGIRCWMASHDLIPGETWAAGLAKAIPESRALILVFSAHANGSKHVHREVERAVHFKIPIVPVRVEPVEPSGELGFLLPSVHWLNASNPPAKGDLERLVQAVRSWIDAGAKPAGSDAAVPAPAKPAAPPLQVALLYKRHVKIDEALLKWLEGAFAARGYQVFVDRQLRIGEEWW